MWKKKIVVIVQIYVSRAALLLFFDNQYTKYEQCEIYISISKMISTEGKQQRLYGTNISGLYNMGEECCGNYSYLWS